LKGYQRRLTTYVFYVATHVDLCCVFQSFFWQSREQLARHLHREQALNSFGSVSQLLQDEFEQGALGLAVCFCTTASRSAPVKPMSSQYSSSASFHSFVRCKSSIFGGCQWRSFHAKESSMRSKTPAYTIGSQSLTANRRPLTLSNTVKRSGRIKSVCVVRYSFTKSEYVVRYSSKVVLCGRLGCITSEILMCWYRRCACVLNLLVSPSLVSSL
jgi:hypothetical protein